MNKKVINLEHLYSVKDYAKKKDVSVQYIYELIEKQKIEVIKIGKHKLIYDENI